MNQSSIYEKPWLDMVFEGKNKQYGAYVLRQEQKQTTSKAFILALLLFALPLAILFVLSSFTTNKPLENVSNDERIVTVKVAKIETKEENKEKKQAIKKKTIKDDIITSSKKPVVAAKETITPEVNLAYGKPETSKEASTEGSINGTTTLTTITTETITATPVIEEEKTETIVDKPAEYPGGIEKFYRYIMNNFKERDLDANGDKIAVTLYFIVEKDGSISNVKAIRYSKLAAGKEGERVLQALQTKWKPALKNGKPVRTVYTLPIVVKP